MTGSARPPGAIPPPPTILADHPGLARNPICDYFHKLGANPSHSARASELMATDTTLRPGELKNILLHEIPTADLAHGRRLRGRHGARGARRRRPHLRPQVRSRQRDAGVHRAGDRRGRHRPGAESGGGQRRRRDHGRLPEAEGRRPGPPHRPPAGRAGRALRCWGGWWTRWVGRWTAGARSRRRGPARWRWWRRASSCGSR